jgi:YfiH family protein
LNLGTHVGDDPQAVASNRRRLSEALNLPSEPLWLDQVHGTRVVEAVPQGPAQSAPQADAAYARQAGQVCVVLTADCLPVLLCDRAGTRVAAAHAGWRGLAGGVLGATLAAVGGAPGEMMAWLGPAIEPAAFEVGEDVRAAFLACDAMHAVAFERNARGRWQADLAALARRELERLGVGAVFEGGWVEGRGAYQGSSLGTNLGTNLGSHSQGNSLGNGQGNERQSEPRNGRSGLGGDREDGGIGVFRCYADETRFFSYRRDGRTGRMATLIWRES